MNKKAALLSLPVYEMTALLDIYPPTFDPTLTIHPFDRTAGPADVYSARMGGVYGNTVAPRGVPFVAGHDGVGIVARVGGQWGAF
jgi:hypothetical protein